MNIITICNFCKKEFEISKQRYNQNIRQKYNFYCSKECLINKQKTSKNITCAYCQKPIRKTLLQIKRSKSGKNFCSKNCTAIYHNSISKRSGHKSLPYSQAAKNELFYDYKTKAKKKNREFILTQEEFENLILDKCYYCGELPINGNSKPKRLKDNNEVFRYNGIDRKDNNKGYILENVVTSCGFCNHAKFKSTENDYIKNIERTYNYLKETKKL
jgi:hypothetical protein